MKTIVISDCHIGSNESNYRLVNRFLKRLECDRLVLLGDFWDLWDMGPDEIRKEHDDTIVLLKALLARGTEIDYVLGNHDEDYLDDPILLLSDMPVMLRREIKTPDGRRIALIHGQNFDPTFKRWYRFSRFLSWINGTTRKIFGISAKSFSKKTCTDLEGKEYSKAVRKIHDKAKKTFSQLGYDGLIMGHTHAPTYETVRGPTIDFYNAGDWKWSNTYVEIEGNNIELRIYKNERMDDTSEGSL